MNPMLTMDCTESTCHGVLPKYRIAFARVGKTGPPSSCSATTVVRSSNDKLSGVFAVIIWYIFKMYPVVTRNSSEWTDSRKRPSGLDPSPPKG